MGTRKNLPVVYQKELPGVVVVFQSQRYFSFPLTGIYWQAWCKLGKASLPPHFQNCHLHAVSECFLSFRNKCIRIRTMGWSHHIFPIYDECQLSQQRFWFGPALRTVGCYSSFFDEPVFLAAIYHLSRMVLTIYHWLEIPFWGEIVMVQKEYNL